MATDTAPAPAPNGDPEMAVSSPVAGSMANTLTVPSVKLVTYRKLPAGSVFTAKGCAPTGYGEPLIAVAVPLLMEYAETVSSVELVTYKY